MYESISTEATRAPRAWWTLGLVDTLLVAHGLLHTACCTQPVVRVRLHRYVPLCAGVRQIVPYLASVARGCDIVS